MANHQNAATLGVALSLETGSFVTEANKVAYETQKLKNAIAREMKAADKEIQALKYATEDYGKAVSKVTQIERQLESGRLKDIKGSAKAKELLDQAAAYDKVANAARNAMGAQFKMNEQQKMQLTYQTTDLFTQIASGQSPFIAVIQQGGQLKDAMGGVGNALRAIGSLFTVTNVLAGSFALGIGAVGYAFYAAKKEMDDFKDSMTLTGQYAGIAYDELVNLGDGLSKSVGTSIGNAREVLASVQSSGKFTQQTLESVSTVILKFSQLTGLSASEAASKLIPSLDGTASSAKKLNEQYHFLTIEQYKHIKALEKQGNLQEAAKLTADALSESFTKTKRDLGTLETAWKNVTEFASQAWDAMLGFGREPGMDRAKVLEKKINELTLEIEERTRKGLKSGSQQAAIASFKTELQSIVDRISGEMDAAEKASKIAQKNEKAIAEEEKYGEMLKKKASEVAKAESEAKFAVAKQGKNEIEKLELESEKKIQEAKLEMDQKNQQEDFRAKIQNLKIYNANVIVAEAELAEKKKQINSKDKIALRNAMEAYKQEQLSSSNEWDKQAAAADIAAKATTKQLEDQKEQLQLKSQMMYATEKEIALAQIALNYDQLRKDAKYTPGGESKIQQLNQQEAIQKFNIEIQDSMKRTQQVFDTVWGNLSSAIDNFVKTGKLNMKDFARSVIQDLIAIQMKAAAMRFLGGLFSSGFAGGANMQIANGTIGDYNALGALSEARASGGTVTNNTPYMVGERGPELFVPSGSGTIIPNGQMGNVGGVTNVTNNYINAIDTKSFEDRLLGSSNAIWAANQYANKSLAVNRGRA